MSHSFFTLQYTCKYMYQGFWCGVRGFPTPWGWFLLPEVYIRNITIMLLISPLWRASNNIDNPVPWLLFSRFNADTSAAMRWQFRPHQKEIKLVPGETALAFYTARNPTDKPVTGIATYNVIPFEAGLYFNKIQCFCFEEQRLNPREQVCLCWGSE